MNELTKNAFNQRPDIHIQTEGEWAGWRTWTRDAFETHNGPFWHRIDETGKVQCAFRVEKKHLNGSQRNVHGGCFMTFADYCLFAIAASHLQGPAVTVAFACKSSSAIGLPTVLLRPMTTACLPRRSKPVDSISFMQPYGVHGRKPVESPSSNLPTFNG